MKKLTVLLFLIIILSFTGCDKGEYTMEMPRYDSIIRVDMTKGSYTRTIETDIYIEDFSDMFADQEFYTTKKSKSGEPKIDINNSDSYIKFEIYTEDGKQTFFIYDKNKKRYLEQPEGGIYEISRELFSDVNIFYTNRRQDVSQQVKDRLTAALEILKPLDEYGEEFKVADFTNEELLRYAFLQFNPGENNTDSITFKELNEKYIIESFGITTATPEDIICSCGRTMAEYNKDNDTYTFDKDYHYLQHIPNSYYSIKDIYRTDDKYIVELYKVFTDIKANASEDEYNYYATYSDSKERVNAFESIPAPEYTEEEYLGRIGMKNIKLFKYTFTNEEPSSFIDCEIMGYRHEITDGSNAGRRSSNPFRLLFWKIREWMYD